MIRDELNSCIETPRLWQKNQQLIQKLEPFGQAIPGLEPTRSVWHALELHPRSNSFFNLSQELRLFAKKVREEGRPTLIRLKAAILLAQSVIHPDDPKLITNQIGTLNHDKDQMLRAIKFRDPDWMYPTVDRLRFCNPETLAEQIGFLNMSLLLPILGWEGEHHPDFQHPQTDKQAFVMASIPLYF